MNDNKLIEKLSKTRLSILMNQPFLGYVLQQYEIKLVDNIDTAATNGENIIFSRKFLNELSINDTAFILLHELLHIILLHPIRKERRNHQKFNIACDIVVNDILKKFNYKTDKLKPIYGDLFNLNGFNDSVEIIYDKLPIKIINICLIDSHDFWDSNETKIKNKLAWSINNAHKKGYSLDGYPHLRNILLSHIEKSKINWKTLLKQCIEKDLFDYTYQRTDRRINQFLLPTFLESEETLQKVWFLVDVSGSMSNDEIIKMYSEILSVVSNYKKVVYDISFFSTEVTPPIQFKNEQELIKTLNSINSTGGTDFIEIFKALPKYYPIEKPKAMIILTDGYSRYPKKTEALNVKVFWAINNDSSKPPFGVIISV